MNARKVLHTTRKHRAVRVRATIFGTAEKPRLSVHKSGSYLYVQLINDQIQKTIASASTISMKSDKSTPIQKAVKIGEMIAKAAKDKKIGEAVFDRGRYRYHGIIKAVADSARKNGLKF